MVAAFRFLLMIQPCSWPNWTQEVRLCFLKYIESSNRILSSFPSQDTTILLILENLATSALLQPFRHCPFFHRSSQAAIPPRIGMPSNLPLPIQHASISCTEWKHRPRQVALPGSSSSSSIDISIDSNRRLHRFRFKI
jgi:hypothetical protein